MMVIFISLGTIKRMTTPGCRVTERGRKLQTPNSKHQRSSKLQAPKFCRANGFWNLMLGSSLELGAWCLKFSFLVSKSLQNLFGNGLHGGFGFGVGCGGFDFFRW